MPVKMPKHFEFINNKSDVFVVGNSQLNGFTGLDKECGMNISMCKGATILDCLDECKRRYRNMKNKVKLFYLQTKYRLLENKQLNHTQIKYEHAL